jgi:hypothetical protein
MKKLTFGFILVLVTFLAATAVAGPDPAAPADEVDNLNSITAYLVGQSFIASRTELRAIDSDPVPELVAIAADRRKKPFVRERAIKCMSLFRDARVKKGFSEMLGGRPDKYFSLVVMAYLEAFGEDAVEDIKPFLTHKKADVRATVVKGFGIFGGQKGYDLLVELEATESNPQVQAAIRGYVQ